VWPIIVTLIIIGVIEVIIPISSHRYIANEFPHLEGNKCTVYSVPKHPVQRTEHQVGNYR